MLDYRASQHEANGCEFQECERGAIEIFPIPGESAAAVQPRDGPFDDPTLGQFHEPFRRIGSFDDLGFDTRQDCSERIGENRPLISAVGEQFSRDKGN